MKEIEIWWFKMINFIYFSSSCFSPLGSAISHVLILILLGTPPSGLLYLSTTLLKKEVSCYHLLRFIRLLHLFIHLSVSCIYGLLLFSSLSIPTNIFSGSQAHPKAPYFDFLLLLWSLKLSKWENLCFDFQIVFDS